MKKIHYLDPYLANPMHPITVALIGCGGTGSHMLTQLGRIHHSLTALGHPGLYVTAFDEKKVSPANIGRQLFSEQEIGTYKSNSLITRINRFYGTDWESIPTNYTSKTEDAKAYHNFFITCVDSANSRREIFNRLSKQPSDKIHISSQPKYWLDTGNTEDSGQVILGSLQEIKQPEESSFNCITQLPTLLDRYPDIEQFDTENEQGPSCSVAQALHRQDLMVNSIVAQYGGHVLWSFLKNRFLVHPGMFLNLSTLVTRPLNL